MSNKSSDTLFVLLKQFNSEEIIELKKYFTKAYANESTIFIKLLTILYNETEYDEKIIIESSGQTKEQYARMKNYLFEKTIQYINELFTRNEDEVWNLIKTAESLVNLNLAEKALSYLQKAEQICQEKEFFYLITPIVNLKCKAYELLGDGSALKKLTTNYLSEQVKYYNILLKEAEYKEMALEAKCFTNYKSDSESNKLNKLKEKLQINNLSRAKTFNSKKNYYLAQKVIDKNEGEFFKSLVNSISEVELLQNFNSNPNEYFSSFNELITTVFLTNKIKEFKYLREQIETFYKNLPKKQALHFRNNFQCIIYKIEFNEGFLSKSIAKMKVATEGYEAFFKRRKTYSEDKLEYDFNTALFLVLQQENSKALKKINNLLNTSGIELIHGFYFPLKLMQILLMIEDTIKYESIIDNLIRSLNRYLGKSSSSVEYETLILKTIKKIILAQDDSVGQKKISQVFSDSLKIISLKKSEKNKIILFKINFELWLKAYIAKLKYDDLYFKS